MGKLIFNDVSYKIGSAQILEQLSLTIDEGEFVVVVGPSGSGKSSLLRLIAGFDNPTQGQIYLNDNRLDGMPPAKRDIAMVFQNYALYPHMTVYKNMAYCLKLRGLSRAAQEEKVNAVARVLKLQDVLSRYPSELSGGQRQRVAMGRAMVREPSVFLFDEPLSNLDPKLRVNLRHEIKKLHQTLGKTTLYVTHDYVEAMTLATRIVVMNQGRVEQVGTPADIYHRPASQFVAELVGQYAMNFLKTTWTPQGTLLLSAHPKPLPAPVLENEGAREDVLMGIRPEHIKICDAEPHLVAKVAYTDRLGADTWIFCETTAGESIGLVVHDDIDVGDEVGLEFVLPSAHLFCPRTHKRIGGWQ